MSRSWCGAIAGPRSRQELSREAQQQRNQSLWWFHEPDGSLTIKARLPAEIGALFIKAIQAAEDSIPGKDVSAETFSERTSNDR